MARQSLNLTNILSEFDSEFHEALDLLCPKPQVFDPSIEKFIQKYSTKQCTSLDELLEMQPCQDAEFSSSPSSLEAAAKALID